MHKGRVMTTGYDRYAMTNSIIQYTIPDESNH